MCGNELGQPACRSILDLGGQRLFLCTVLPGRPPVRQRTPGTCWLGRRALPCARRAYSSAARADRAAARVARRAGARARGAGTRANARRTGSGASPRQPALGGPRAASRRPGPRPPHPSRCSKHHDSARTRLRLSRPVTRSPSRLASGSKPAARIRTPRAETRFNRCLTDSAVRRNGMALGTRGMLVRWRRCRRWLSRSGDPCST